MSPVSDAEVVALRWRMRRVKTEPRRCDSCGRSFFPYRERQVSCSAKCRKRRYNQDHVEERRELQSRYRQQHRERLRAYDRDRRASGALTEEALEKRRENNRRYRREHYDELRARENEVARKRLRENPGYLHHLTKDQYYALRHEQNDACAVCLKPFERTPLIDHDHRCCPKKHSCGKCVRGLVCYRCNALLGQYDAGLFPRVEAYQATYELRIVSS